MTSHYVVGGGGTRLHVLETGNPQGTPILFIHGFSQCGLCWGRQLNSDLAKDHRLVAMDLRGHGLSDKPRDAYTDSKLWADDVNAVIQALDLEQAILTGWSYGPLLILDYLRHYGERAIGGIHFVGGISKLGSEAALSVLTAEFLGNVPGLLSTDAEESVRALEALLDLAFESDLTPEERYLALGWNAHVPPYVRQGMFARAFDNDDLLPTVRKPVLITHSDAETIVKPAAAAEHLAAMPHAQAHWTRDVGHAPFWDQPVAFNQRLREFVADARKTALTQVAT
jgi:Predicted hydrolases or acyltransferases (alpha/beta hydrolase superfamily)